MPTEKGKIGYWDGAVDASELVKAANELVRDNLQSLIDECSVALSIYEFDGDTISAPDDIGVAVWVGDDVIALRSLKEMLADEADGCDDPQRLRAIASYASELADEVDRDLRKSAAER